MELIEIPPPRPKRKPMHPYPRKLVDHLINTEVSKKDQQRSPSPNSSFSEQEQQSPTSVLSAVGSGSTTPSPIEEIGSSSPPPLADPMAVASDPHEVFLGVPFSHQLSSRKLSQPRVGWDNNHRYCSSVSSPTNSCLCHGIVSSFNSMCHN